MPIVQLNRARAKPADIMPHDLRADPNLALGARGVIIDGGVDLAAIEKHLPEIELVVIAFANAADGRGFSLARQLKNRAAFRGRIRAVGDLVIDQYQFLQRCGFDEVETERVDDNWRDRAGAFTLAYQAASEGEPLTASGEVKFKRMR